jgi:uncharacterized membrane protein
MILTLSSLTLKYNGKTIAKTDYTPSGTGKICLGSRNGDIYIDDIEYKTDLRPFGYREWEWEYVRGIWDWGRTVQLLKSNDKKNALIFTGREFWKNYSLTAAVKTSESAGICFCVQDSVNYYLYEILHNKVKAKRSQIALCKVENGIKTVMRSKPYDFNKGDWYKLNVRKNNNEITAYIDDCISISCVDSTFEYGSIGLSSKSNNEFSFFEDVKINPVSKGKPQTPNQFIYTFTNLENAGYDVCDWINSGKTFFKDQSKTKIKKEIFDEALIINKKIFSGYFSFKSLHYRPSDIDYNIYIWADTSYHYKIAFKKGEVEFLRNNEIVINKSFYLYRNRIEIEYSNHVWRVNDEDLNILEYIQKIFFLLKNEIDVYLNF